MNFNLIKLWYVWIERWQNKKEIGHIVVLCSVPTKWQFGFQFPGSTGMEKIIDLHNDIMVFLVFIIFFISWMLVRTVYLFRSSNTETIRFSFQHHTLLEQIWTIVPAVILVLIAAPSFSLLYAMDELRDPKLTVHCIGNQWYWSYEFPDYTLNANEKFDAEVVAFDSYMLSTENLPKGGFRLLEVDNALHLPVKQEIRLLISSRDVIHSWAVPSLGVKMDAIPGRTNQVSLYITRKGQFYGQCSELCGVQHSFMPVTVHATSFKGWNVWIYSLQLGCPVTSEILERPVVDMRRELMVLSYLRDREAHDKSYTLHIRRTKSRMFSIILLDPQIAELKWHLAIREEPSRARYFYEEYLKEKNKFSPSRPREDFAKDAMKLRNSITAYD